MIFLLHFLTTSLFVPYHNTETPVLFQFNDKELAYAKSLYRPFIVLVVSDYARYSNDQTIEIMAQLSLEFGEKALFGMMFESKASQIFSDPQMVFLDQDQIIHPPFVAYYDIGHLISVTSFIKDEVAMAHTLSFWINGPQIVSNSKELLESLGNTPISILSKKSDLMEAFNITNKALSVIGPLELIQVEDDLFETINLPNYNLSVFVKEDMSINGFTDYAEFIKFSRPHFSIFEKSDITNNIYNNKDYDIVAIFDTKIKPEYNETLYELRENYPQFIYGIVNKEDLFDEYTYYTHKEINNLPAILIFNPEKMFYYPHPENLNNNQNISTLLNEYVRLVVEGEIQKKYMSEELNKSISDDSKDKIPRLTGNNFEEFVNDTEKDTLIFFETPENWPYYFKFFENVRNNISSLGINLKFGYIDPKRNSSPYRFPKIYSHPLIELYLKDGKMIPMLNIVNEEGILRFLHFFASDGKSIPSTNFTSAQARSEKYRITSIYRNHCNDYLDLYNTMFENIDNPANISSIN